MLLSCHYFYFTDIIWSASIPFPRNFIKIFFKSGFFQPYPILTVTASAILSFVSSHKVQFSQIDQAGGPGVRVGCCPAGALVLPTSALGAKCRSSALCWARRSWAGGASRGSRERVRAASCCSSGSISLAAPQGLHCGTRARLSTPSSHRPDLTTGPRVPAHCGLRRASFNRAPKRAATLSTSDMFSYTSTYVVYIHSI